MDDSGKSHLVLSVKDLKSIVHVDMPCFVKSSSSVLKMMGGADMISSTVGKDSNQIQLRFPSGNPCSPNQIGSKIENNGFLVKIRRKKNTGAGEVCVKVIGVIKKSYVFNSPSDYQVLFNNFVALYKVV